MAKKQTKKEVKKPTKTKVATKPKKKDVSKTKKVTASKKSVSEVKKEVSAPVKPEVKETKKVSAPVETKVKETKEAPKATETAKPVTKLHARDYRQMARETLKPCKGSFAVTYFVYTILVGAITAIFSSLYLIDANKGGAGIGFEIGSSLMALFTLLTAGPFLFSFIYMAKNIHHEKKQPKIGDIFHGFKRFGQSLGIYIIVNLFTILWSLLLIIPGIIKHFAYILSPYIAYDNPNKPILECITESRHKMKGHKWQYFCLWISHIGWFLLIIITFGIMSFWVLPKLDQARYRFYLHVTNQD